MGRIICRRNGLVSRENKDVEQCHVLRPHGLEIQIGSPVLKIVQFNPRLQ